MDKKSQFEYQYFYKRHLPHIQPKGASIFVTYRLAFSLPKSILDELALARKKCDMKLKSISIRKKREFKEKSNRMLFQMTDKFLDNYKGGPHWLGNAQIAEIVIESLFENHGKKYDLECYVVMSNHVHALIQPKLKREDAYYSLAEIMHSHKGYTAWKANRVLGRQGQFWHHETYDHYIRDADEYDRVVTYIMENPVNAGLIVDYRDWLYSFMREM